MTKGLFKDKILDQVVTDVFDEKDELYNMKPNEVVFRKSERGLEVIAGYKFPNGRVYRRFKGLAFL